LQKKLSIKNKYISLYHEKDIKNDV
jgi:hypothetical protein